MERDLVLVPDRAEERAVGAVPESGLEEGQGRAGADPAGFERHRRREGELPRHAPEGELPGHPKLALAIADDSGRREADRRVPLDVELIGRAHGLGHVGALAVGEVALHAQAAARGGLVDPERGGLGLDHDRAGLGARGVIVDASRHLGGLDDVVMGEPAAEAVPEDVDREARPRLVDPERRGPRDARSEETRGDDGGDGPRAGPTTWGPAAARPPDLSVTHDGRADRSAQRAGGSGGESGQGRASLQSSSGVRGSRAGTGSTGAGWVVATRGVRWTGSSRSVWRIT